MKRLLCKAWQEDDGVLSFEWVLLATVLVIGIVGGAAAARDAIIDEFGDVAEATLSFDQSYFIAGLTILADDGVTVLVDIEESTYTDDGYVYEDCGRNFAVPGQAGQFDADDGG